MAQNLGTINRLRASVAFQDHPELNILPSYLGKEMITWSPQGDQTKVLPAAIGTVNSPEPYQLVEFSAQILKTNGLGERFKTQWESYTVLGDCVLRGDSSGMGDFPVYNTSIKGVDAVKNDGSQESITVHFQGFYPINSSLYNV